MAAHNINVGNMYSQLMRRESNLPFHNNARNFTASLYRERLRVAKNLYNTNLVGHYGCVNAVEFSHGGRFLASGGDDKRVLVWDVEKSLAGLSQPRVLSFEHASNIFCLGFDSVNRKLISGGNDDLVVCHDFETGKMENVFKQDNPVYGLSIDPKNDSLFVTASENGKILLFDQRCDANDPLIVAEQRSSFHAVEYHPHGNNLLVTANSRQGAALYDARKPNQMLMQYGNTKDGTPTCMSVRFNRKGDLILALRRRQPPILFRLHSPQPVCTFYHKNYYNSCTMKSCTFAGEDDELVISGSDDFNLYAWRVADVDLDSIDQWIEKTQMVLYGHRSIVNQVRYNREKCLLASSGVEKIVKIWSPFSQRNWSGGLLKEAKASENTRELFSPIFMNVMTVSSLSHDYSSQNTNEDPRMLAFFDSLIRQEIEGIDHESHTSTESPDSDEQSDERADYSFISNSIPNSESFSASSTNNSLSELYESTSNSSLSSIVEPNDEMDETDSDTFPSTDSFSEDDDSDDSNDNNQRCWVLPLRTVHTLVVRKNNTQVYGALQRQRNNGRQGLPRRTVLSTRKTLDSRRERSRPNFPRNRLSQVTRLRRRYSSKKRRILRTMAVRNGPQKPYKLKVGNEQNRSLGLLTESGTGRLSSNSSLLLSKSLNASMTQSQLDLESNTSDSDEPTTSNRAAAAAAKRSIPNTNRQTNIKRRKHKDSSHDFDDTISSDETVSPISYYIPRDRRYANWSTNNLTAVVPSTSTGITTEIKDNIMYLRRQQQLTMDSDDDDDDDGNNDCEQVCTDGVTASASETYSDRLHSTRKKANGLQQNAEDTRQVHTRSAPISEPSSSNGATINGNSQSFVSQTNNQIKCLNVDEVVRTSARKIASASSRSKITNNGDQCTSTKSLLPRRKSSRIRNMASTNSRNLFIDGHLNDYDDDDDTSDEDYSFNEQQEKSNKSSDRKKRLKKCRDDHQRTNNENEASVMLDNKRVIQHRTRCVRMARYTTNNNANSSFASSVLNNCMPSNNEEGVHFAANISSSNASNINIENGSDNPGCSTNMRKRQQASQVSVNEEAGTTNTDGLLGPTVPTKRIRLSLNAARVVEAITAHKQKQCVETNRSRRSVPKDQQTKQQYHHQQQQKQQLQNYIYCGQRTPPTVQCQRQSSTNLTSDPSPLLYTPDSGISVNNYNTPNNISNNSNSSGSNNSSITIINGNSNLPETTSESGTNNNNASSITQDCNGAGECNRDGADEMKTNNVTKRISANSENRNNLINENDGGATSSSAMPTGKQGSQKFERKVTKVRRNYRKHFTCDESDSD